MQRTGLNRHRRGYATKEAGSAVHFPVSGPIGLAQSSNCKSSNFIIIDHHILYFSSFDVLFYHYRYYSTKHGRRSYTTYQGTSRNEKYQSYLMQLGIKQFL